MYKPNVIYIYIYYKKINLILISYGISVTNKQLKSSVFIKIIQLLLYQNTFLDLFYAPFIDGYKRVISVFIELQIYLDKLISCKFIDIMM